MNKFIKYSLIIFILLTLKSVAEENFFEKAKNLFEQGKIDESKL